MVLRILLKRSLTKKRKKIMSMTNINIGVVIKMMMGFLRVDLRVS